MVGAGAWVFGIGFGVDLRLFAAGVGAWVKGEFQNGFAGVGDGAAVAFGGVSRLRIAECGLRILKREGRGSRRRQRTKEFLNRRLHIAA